MPALRDLFPSDLVRSLTRHKTAAGDEPFRAAFGRHWPLWLSLLLVGLWVLVPSQVNTGQWGDNFEQHVWAQSFELGYHKHPPLSTWMLASLIAGFGPSMAWTSVLAALCTAGTAAFTYGIARHLLPQRVVALAMLFWGLQQAFSLRAQMFNHNTVMMLTVSATAWCVLRAVTSRHGGWWLATGVAAGAALLAKYQSIVPLTGMVLGLLLTGELARRDTRLGLATAVGIAVLVFTPHLLWIVHHDFSTLRYASQEGQSLSWVGRVSSMVSFLAQQVRMLLPALLFAALMRWLPGQTYAGLNAAVDPPDAVRWRQTWFAVLVGFPLAITVLTCPCFGMRLQNHWGFQCLQFVSLWMAWGLRGLAARPARALVTAAVLLQLTSIVLLTGTGWLDGRDPHRGRPEDAHYPAAQLAHAVEADWRAYTTCPLRLVVGPTFEAGAVSMYGSSAARVLEGGDFRKSPWIRHEELSTHGAVFISNDLGDLPEHAQHFGSMALNPQGPTVHWALVVPAGCPARS